MINKREAREAGWKRSQKIGGTTKVMIRRAKRVREGQARERRKEGEPVHFGAHVIRTRFRKTGLVKRAKGRFSYTTARHSTLETREAKS